ncbi:MAG: cation diffusion facilitator family transporter [Caldilineaceae bacterium]|nr:cation diffusion facilitator family transporter [Caldilineaceae bacterium]
MDRNYAAISKVLLITFVLNLLATGAKLSVGLWTGALSLVADGLDTLFDGVSNVVGLIAVRISSRPPDEDHPYGHRKFETMAALFIAAALFVTAWELGIGAVERLVTPVPPTVNRWSVVALLFGAGVQAIAGVWELARGRALQSEVLRADARHTLASIGVSGAVLVGLLLVRLGYPRADALVALLIAGVIVKIGVDTVSENMPALVDRAPLEEAEIAEIVADVHGVESYHRIRSRGPADNVAVDLHIRVDRTLSMGEGNAIADEVRRRLLDLPGVSDVTVHTEARRLPDSSADLLTAVKLIGQEHNVVIHECWVQEVDDVLSLHLHVGVDSGLTLAEAHAQVDSLEAAALERLPQLNAVHTHIELANSEVLPGARVSRSLTERISGVIHDAADEIPALSHPHDICIRQVEGRLSVTVEALVDGAMPVNEAHDLSTRFQELIRTRLPQVGDVLVHLEPEA